MNHVQALNSTTSYNNHNKNHLTEQQKLANRLEANTKVFQLILEKLIEDGGNHNAVSSQN